MLVLEVGDTVADSGRMAQIKLDTYAQALPYMGYDAAGMGEIDLQAMEETGRSKPYGDSVPAICSNVLDAATGKPVTGKPYVIKKMPSGLKVGITAVLGDPLVVSRLQDQMGIRIVPPADALREQVRSLRKKVDVVVALCHTAYLPAKTLAEQVEGIDVILAGHASSEPPGMEKIGTVHIMGTRSAGRSVGRMVLDIDAEGKVTAAKGDDVQMEKAIKDDEEMVKLVAKHDKDIEDYNRSLRASSGLQPAGPKPFVSAIRCGECHSREYQSWSGTGHAKALESLRKDDKANDPECLSCHTTGLKVKGGFTSEAATPQFAGVQCESCHGPGVIHARRPAKGFGAVLQSTCTQCHDPVRSPKFNYKEYRARIVHKKE